MSYLDEEKAAALRSKEACRCCGCGTRLPRGKRKYCSRVCRNRAAWHAMKADPVAHAAEKRRIRAWHRPETAREELVIDKELRLMRFMNGYDGPRPYPVSVWPQVMRHAQLFGVSGLSRLFAR